MRDKVDLHMHSTASDGLFSPQEVMEIAAAAGLRAAGLTDHDTIDGLAEASAAADKCGIELVPGVEISVLDEKLEVHILGYYPLYREQLEKALAETQNERLIRMEKIMHRLGKMGFDIRLEEVLEEADQAAPSRMHLARLLKKKKYVHTTDQAFSLYLNPDCPAYVPRHTLTLRGVMGLLRDVAAVPVIAHPAAESKKLIDLLIPLGLKGIEVYHPQHDKVREQYYARLAHEKDMLITGGSDFHGESRDRPGYPVHRAISGHYLTLLKNCASGKQ